MDYGGGTHGFGKSSFYGVTSLSTIIVYTRTKVNKQFETRLIACALGKQVETKTGRHWWGKWSDDGQVVNPLINDDADAVAEKIGLLTFGDNTGTKVLIISQY